MQRLTLHISPKQLFKGVTWAYNCSLQFDTSRKKKVLHRFFSVTFARYFKIISSQNYDYDFNDFNGTCLKNIISSINEQIQSLPIKLLLKLKGKIIPICYFLCSKSTIETQGKASVVILVFLLLTFNVFHIFFWTVDFEQVIVRWALLWKTTTGDIPNKRAPWISRFSSDSFMLRKAKYNNLWKILNSFS